VAQPQGFDRILSSISERARTLTPAKAAKGLVAFLPYLLGRLLGLVWFLVAWIWSAFVVGFTEGSKRGARME
jgi:hypothetical protein